MRMLKKVVALTGISAGLLLYQAISLQEAWSASATRTSSFEYDATTGLLVKEIVEPDDYKLCVVTTYSYDGFGNRIGATTRNCNGSSGEAVVPQNPKTPVEIAAGITTRTANHA